MPQALTAAFHSVDDKVEEGVRCAIRWRMSVVYSCQLEEVEENAGKQRWGHGGMEEWPRKVNCTSDAY